MKSYCIAQMHVKNYTTPASVEVTTELQAATSLFQVPVYILKKTIGGGEMPRL